LLEREIDIGLAVFSNQSPRIKYHKVGEEKLCYYISKNHPLWPKKKISKDDLVGQKVTWVDNHNRSKAELELDIFVENLKYKMQFYGFSNNLSGALQILLSGHTVVPLPEIYGRSLEKQYPIRKLDIESKGRVLDQMLAHNPSASLTHAAKILIEKMLS
jgi:DNA-binding transcriptional LysR family regulator